MLVPIAGRTNYTAKSNVLKYPALGLSENRFMVFDVYAVLKPRHNEVCFQS